MTLRPTFVSRAKLLERLRAEDGNVATFSVLLFSLMVMIGGLAVDLMRVENTRTTLQQTLDRCTLAAAALQQQLNPDAVCRDYVEKAGMSSYLQSVTVTQTNNSRTVQATAMGTQNNIFAPMIGFNTFPVPASSAARQSISDIEIVLVLDVSGSMSGAKIANLKTAASNFVDTVTANNADNRVSISIVPYNAQVNLPDYLIAQYNATGTATVPNANCLEIPASMYSVGSISRTEPIPRAVYADTASGTSGSMGFVARSTNGNGGATNAFQFCNPRNGDAVTGALTENLVVPPSSDATVLKARINALYAAGNTSITLGMKWGVNMIDPGTRPVYAQLASQGDMTTNLGNRPFDYRAPDKMKFIVLMTDGEHVAHRITAPAYRDEAATSGVWIGEDGNYSIRHTANRPAAAGTNEYWVPHRNDWRAAPWTGHVDNSGTAQQLSWTTLWQQQRMSWVAWQFYARAFATDYNARVAVFNSTMSELTDLYATVTEMNNSLQQSCNLAKANGVVVYGIAFEAPENGQNQIRSCSSSDLTYFQPVGGDLGTAFDSIAAQITQLRLTQ